ncbi:hypothetical protein B0H10DRAFT_2094303 [Mycena sp. CBHHK59/15]|nr:hypothetical protein B0H10DRAFT_2094303 [Mycena sp. CBHHK59/15]
MGRKVPRIPFADERSTLSEPKTPVAPIPGFPAILRYGSVQGTADIVGDLTAMRTVGRQYSDPSVCGYPAPPNERFEAGLATYRGVDNSAPFVCPGSRYFQQPGPLDISHSAGGQGGTNRMCAFGR